MNPPALLLEHLVYRYPDGTPALRGVNLRIDAGERVALIGENGAGKSTLLLHLNGCLHATSGQVLVEGVSVRKDTLTTVRTAVGLVFQQPDDQLFMPTVREDVAFGPRNLRLTEEEVELRVREALRIVGAEALADRPPYRLSLGERRIAALAAVLSMRPRILVLDEPSSHLDPRARRRLIDLLATLTSTCILATHDLDLAAALCPRTVALHEGAVAADGPTAELLRDEALLARCRLERPLSVQACPICGREKNA